MCGRYTETKAIEEFKKHLAFLGPEFEFHPRFNIAPTQQVPVVLNQDQSEVRLLRWGLIPFWAKDEKIGNSLINARAETLKEKPSFRFAIKKQRCLVLADGFYEWLRFADKRPSIPHRFTLQNNEPFFFAGLWDSWKPSENGEMLQTFTIITTDPNELTKKVHDRMPVIMKPENYESWLDPKFNDVDKVVEFLKPYPAKEMIGYTVSTLVNKPGNEDPKCVEKV